MISDHSHLLAELFYSACGSNLSFTSFTCLHCLQCSHIVGLCSPSAGYIQYYNNSVTGSGTLHHRNQQKEITFLYLLLFLKLITHGFVWLFVSPMTEDHPCVTHHLSPRPPSQVRRQKSGMTWWSLSTVCTRVYACVYMSMYVMMVHSTLWSSIYLTLAHRDL